ncbi:lipopolysaccharide-binding protein-like isoform X1 [Montipora capricornis]|uniref:lipopolysaccharide-binding protein-like isoform X1 n=2 Tax=Montipora capricornis TaxID=246305 RepID=UPI0035F15F5D
MANLLFWLACVCLISECYLFVLTAKPGIRMRVTNRALQNADDVGIKVLFKRLKRNLKDISQESGGFYYRIYDITNNHASIQSSSLLTASGKGLALQATGIRLDFSGQLAYKKKVGWFVFQDTVGFNLRVRGIQFNLTVRIGVNSDGQPMMFSESQYCTSHIQSVDVEFYGGHSWLYNFLKKEVNKRVKDALKKFICKQARKTVNEDGTQFLANYPLFSKVRSFAGIDYSIIEEPIFTDDYMDVPLKGEFKPIGNFSTAAVPFFPITLPTSPNEVDKMVYIWLTDYVFNTASFVYQERGALQTIISQKDLPINSRFLLNTNVLKDFLNKLYTRYPNRPLLVKVYTTKAPVFTSSINITNITVNAKAKIYVTAINRSHVYALTLGLKAVLDGYLDVKHGNLTFHATSFRTQVRLFRPGMEKSNISRLQTFVEQVVHSWQFLAYLNVLGSRGFPLPMIRGLILKDTAITTGKGFTVIKANLKHQR